jgi:hypothetical protein
MNPLLKNQEVLYISTSHSVFFKILTIFPLHNIIVFYLFQDNTLSLVFALIGFRFVEGPADQEIASIVVITRLVKNGLYLKFLVLFLSELFIFFLLL